MPEEKEKLSGAEKPILGTGCNGEIKKDLPRIETDNKGLPSGKTEEEQKPPADFKVAEIWIRSGRIMLDATESFWTDRCRALGLLEFCKDIVKTAQPPKKESGIIIPGNGGLGHKIMNFARKFKRRK